MWTGEDASEHEQLPSDVAWVVDGAGAIWDPSGDAALLLNPDDVIISRVDVTHT